MELHFSEGLKVSDFFNLPMFSGKYGFPKISLSLWFHVQHHLLISKKDFSVQIAWMASMEISIHLTNGRAG